MELKKKCPICGKEWEILDADSWGYKVRVGSNPTIYFCRYNCKRQWEMKNEKPAKKLIIEEEPARRTEKNRRPPMASRELIEKVLEAREEGESGVEVLEKLGYEHWKKWHRLKKWAENHDPELRKRMPDTLADKRRKEDLPAEEPETKPEQWRAEETWKKDWDKWITPEAELTEQNDAGGVRTASRSDFEKMMEQTSKIEEARSAAVVQMIRAWDRAHERPEPGTPVTFPKTSAPKPSMEAIAVRTEIGEFSELPNGIITWKFGEMHAALNRYEWHDMMEIVPAVLEALGKELGG